MADYKFEAKKTIMITINMDEVIDNLADGGNDYQAQMFSQFATDLKKHCQDEYHINNQICSIADSLSEDGKDLINRMYHFIQSKAYE